MWHLALPAAGKGPTFKHQGPLAIVAFGTFPGIASALIHFDFQGVALSRALPLAGMGRAVGAAGQAGCLAYDSGPDPQPRMHANAREEDRECPDDS